MKNFIKNSDGYITIETSVIMALFIIIFLFGFSLLLNFFSNNIEFCTAMRERGQQFSDKNFGNVMRVVKVISETGGRLTNEIFQNIKE